MKKKYLAIGCLLVAFICLSGCTRVIKEGDFQFKYDPIGATSVMKYTGSNTIVEIPAEFKNTPVNYIFEGAFKDLPNLQEVRILGEDVSLARGAFDNCPNLSNVSASGKISLSLFGDVFVNCPSMPTQTASSGSGNIRATYNASRGEIYLQFPTIYNGKSDLLGIAYR